MSVTPQAVPLPPPGLNMNFGPPPPGPGASPGTSTGFNPGLAPGGAVAVGAPPQQPSTPGLDAPLPPPLHPTPTTGSGPHNESTTHFSASIANAPVAAGASSPGRSRPKKGELTSKALHKRAHTGAKNAPDTTMERAPPLRGSKTGQEMLSISDESDGATEQAFSALFHDYAVDGLITGTDLCDILRELGLAHDVATVEQVLAVDWGEVDYESALDVMEFLKGTEETLENADKTLTTTGETIVSVGVGEIIWRTITCSKEANVVYQVIAPTVNLKPREILISTTSLVMMLTGTLIILTISLLWIAQAKDGETRSMQNFGDAMGSFIENFEAELMASNGKELADVGAVIAQADDDRAVRELGSLQVRFEREAQCMSSALQQVDSRRFSSEVQRAASYLEVTASGLYRAAPTAFANLSRIHDHLVLHVNYTDAFVGSQWSVVLLPGVSVTTTTSSSTGSSSTTVTYPSSPLALRRSPCLAATTTCTWKSLSWIHSVLDSSYTKLGSHSAAKAQAAMEAANSFGTAISTTTKLTSVVSEREIGPQGSGVAYACVALPLDAQNGDKFRGALCVLQEQTTMTATSLAAHKLHPIFSHDEQWLHLSSSKGEAAKFSASKELVRVDSATGAVIWEENAPNWGTPGAAFAACYSATNVTALGGLSCNDINGLIVQAILSREPQRGLFEAGPRTGTPIVAVVSPTKTGDSAIVLTMPQLDYVSEGWKELSQVFSDLNYIRIFEGGATVEIVLMLRNSTTQEMYQASPYAFLPFCLGPCVRRREAIVNAEVIWDQQISVFSITPDYRPEPVMGGGGGARRLMDYVILVERDVVEIRKITMNNLAAMLNDNNREFRGSFEVQMLHHLEQPLTKTYDPYKKCAASVGCVSAGEYGIVYRTDCTHCSRFNADSVTYTSALRPMEYLTVPTLNATCSPACPLSHIENNPGDIARIAVDNTKGGSVFDHVDYRGVRTVGFYGRADNFTAAFYLKEDYEDIYDPINTQIFISLGSSVGIVIFSLVVLFVLGRRLIDDIEEDWLHYKENIKEERKAFADSVRGILPAHFAEKVMVGSLMTVENRLVSVGFVEVVGIGARSREWSPLAFVRFLTYILHVSELLAVHHDIYRLRTVGDVSIFLGGVSATADTDQGSKAKQSGGDQDGEKGEKVSATNTSQMHHVVRLLYLVTNLFQASTKRYAHFPHRAALMEKTFGAFTSDFPDKQGLSEHVGTCVMPMMRAGLHVGTASLCVLNAGKTPHFDVYGSPLMGIAKRISHHARVATIRTTEAVVEQARKSPQGDLFAFDNAHTTLIRGRGMVTTYNMSIGDVPLPLNLLQEVGVRFSKRRKIFSYDKDETPEHSILSGSVVSGATATYTKGMEVKGPNTEKE